MRADGSSTVVLTAQRGTGGSDARWSPNGSRVAFEASGQLWVVNADGTDLRVLAQNLFQPPSIACNSCSMAGEFSWAPNGKRIVFARERGGANDSALFTVTTQGIPTLRRIKYRPVAHFPVAVQPTWSPDGRHIAFSDMAPFKGPGLRLPHSIVVMRADGSHVHVLHHGQDPVWSPNGAWIAGRIGSGFVLTMRADGTRARTWPAGGETFSPGGSRLAYDQPNDLYVANADGSHRVRVLHDPDLSFWGVPLWRGGTARG
jgi:Tol biopolymer transport system component